MTEKQATAAQQDAARIAGIPASQAHRVRGGTAHELVADAHRLAEEFPQKQENPDDVAERILNRSRQKAATDADKTAEHILARKGPTR